MIFSFDNFGELGAIISRMTEEEKKIPVRYCDCHEGDTIIHLGHMEFAAGEGVFITSGDNSRSRKTARPQPGGHNNEAARPAARRRGRWRRPSRSH